MSGQDYGDIKNRRLPDLDRELEIELGRRDVPKKAHGKLKFCKKSPTKEHVFGKKIRNHWMNWWIEEQKCTYCGKKKLGSYKIHTKKPNQDNRDSM